MRHKPYSPKQLASFGWAPAPDPLAIGAWRQRKYVHQDGWVISHCGHPTALWPYALFNPQGAMILTGAAGPLRRPDYGTAWPTVAAAVDYVASQPRPARSEGISRESEGNSQLQLFG